MRSHSNLSLKEDKEKKKLFYCGQNSSVSSTESARLEAPLLISASGSSSTHSASCEAQDTKGIGGKNGHKRAALLILAVDGDFGCCDGEFLLLLDSLKQ